MTDAPRKLSDPAGDRARAIRHAADRARTVDEAEAELGRALAFAAGQGAWVRELAEATGRRRRKVKRLIARARQLR
jgi:hypothetical protein